MEFITKTASETKELGKKIGSNLKGGEIFALEGELGAGKTTFIQGLAEGMGIGARVNSPTFILMRFYKGKKNLYHIDLYRLEEDIDTQLSELGIKDAWGKEENVVVIEWADKVKDIYPPHTQRVVFKEIDENTRKITFIN